MANNYDDIYKNSSRVFNNCPADCVVESVKLFHGNTTARTALDIGAGQGRNCIYLLESGFNVVALDSSSVACRQLSDLDRHNLEVVNTNVSDFHFKPNEYDLVLLINVLHFMNKESAVAALADVKKSLRPGGIMTVSILLDNGKFGRGELKDLFMNDNQEIVTYSETNEFDPGHPGNPNPHRHTIATIIARLKS